MSGAPASLGLLGLGRMGGAVGRRCLHAGLAVTGFDPDPAACAAFAAAGGQLAGSPAEVADREHTVLAFLPTAGACREAVAGSRGVVHGSRIRCYVEGSTIGIAAVRALAGVLQERGIALVDAPVSGGPRGAEAGTLLVIASAADAAWSAAEPLLRHYAGQCLRVGAEPGLAQACKLVNNAMNMAALATACEAAAAGVAAGLDLATLVDAVNRGTGRSAATETKFPAAIVPRTFDYGASMAVAAKDTLLFCEEAEALGLPVPLARSVAAAWERASEAGPQRDFTELFLDYERLYAHARGT